MNKPIKTAQDWIDRLDDVNSERDQRNWVEAIQADALWEAAAIVHRMSRGTKSEDRAIAIDEARDLLADAAHSLEPGRIPSFPVTEEEAEKFMAEFDAGKHPLGPGDLAALEKGREQLMADIKKILSDDAHLRIARLSDCLRDVINLFNQADKAPAGNAPLCTGDRREMWEQVLKRYGTP